MKTGVFVVRKGAVKAGPLGGAVHPLTLKQSIADRCVQFHLEAYNLGADFHLMFQTLILHVTPSVSKLISKLQSGEKYSLTWHLKASSCSLRS